jgi:hypothetical protein
MPTPILGTATTISGSSPGGTANTVNFVSGSHTRGGGGGLLVITLLDNTSASSGHRVQFGGETITYRGSFDFSGSSACMQWYWLDTPSTSGTATVEVGMNNVSAGRDMLALVFDVLYASATPTATAATNDGSTVSAIDCVAQTGTANDLTLGVFGNNDQTVTFSPTGSGSVLGSLAALANSLSVITEPSGTSVVVDATLSPSARALAFGLLLVGGAQAGTKRQFFPTY